MGPSLFSDGNEFERYSAALQKAGFNGAVAIQRRKSIAYTIQKFNHLHPVPREVPIQPLSYGRQPNLLTSWSHINHRVSKTNPPPRERRPESANHSTARSAPAIIPPPRDVHHACISSPVM